MQDDIFTKPYDGSFVFDEKVAGVFDDMISRSIPGYGEILKLAKSAVFAYAPQNATLIDIGCSTANFLISLAALAHEKNIRLIGIDNSESMLEIARKKIISYEAEATFYCQNICDTPLESAHIISSLFTLQFIHPDKREQLVATIFHALKPNGIFLLAEKLVSDDETLTSFMVEEYYAYKRAQGYSQLEIMRKRDALEHVLVPYSAQKNEQLLKNAGFTHVETLFRWCNFALFIAVKR